MFYGQISNSAYYTLRRENGVYQKQYGPISAATAPVPYVASGGTVIGSGTTPGTCTPVAPATVCYTNPGSYVSYAPQGGVPIYTPPGPPPIDFVTGQRRSPQRVWRLSRPQLITIRGMDPSFSNPLSHSYDIAVEQELPLHASFSIGYVGNRATHLPVYIDTNVDPNSVTTAHTYLYTNRSTGTAGAFVQPIYTNRLYTTTGAVATGFSILDSWYNSMVVTVRKPMAHGIEVLGKLHLGQGDRQRTDLRRQRHLQRHRRSADPLPSGRPLTASTMSTPAPTSTSAAA